MADIVTGLAALKTALEIAKELKNATAAYNEAEFRLKLSDLYNSLSEARIELADAQIEIHGLNAKVKELEGKLNAPDEMVYRDGVYYRAVPLDNKPNGPFCPACYEGPSRKTSSMSRVDAMFSHAGKYKCNTCKAYIK
ncbi:hypothetical protein PUG81_01630 [Erwiniaceae bacterium L1_54_6]|nr:hypothetical protein [Erwiniaceae bacterium L1_54_6]